MKQPSGIWYDIDTTTYVYIYKVPEPNWTAETWTDTERTGTKEVLVPHWNQEPRFPQNFLCNLGSWFQGGTSTFLVTRHGKITYCWWKKPYE